MSMQNPVPPQPRVSGDGLDLSDSAEAESNRFISVSASSCKLLKQAEIVGPHLRLGIIEGEAGAGKHTLAHILYRLAVKARPQLAKAGFIRCDAREWLLSEYEPATQTGFTYLDRVDLLAAPGQALLLGILKNLDARSGGAFVLVVSSESSLREMAANGKFLSDLALRLGAVRLVIPPLRERREDIVPLANLFLERIRLHYHLAPLVLAPNAVSRLLAHDWPGNVRELLSLMESAVLECANGIIREEDLCIHSASPQRAAPPAQTLNLDAVIHGHLHYVLELNHGNKLRTARQLGISRSTLYRMLEGSNSSENVKER